MVLAIIDEMNIPVLERDPKLVSRKDYWPKPAGFLQHLKLKAESSPKKERKIENRGIYKYFVTFDSVT